MKICLKSLLIPVVIVFLLLTISHSFAQSLNVSATIPAHPTDYQAVITPVTAGENFPQNTLLTYHITYGTYLANSNNFVLEAQWPAGTIAGQPNPSTDVLEYVIGSASKGYGNVSPVIDIANNKISWTFTDFPANTHDQTVTFQMRTTANYTGDKIVTFPVTSNIVGSGTKSADSTISQTYVYKAPQVTPQITLTPTSTPQPTQLITPGVTTQPTIAPTTITTPTPIKITPSFSGISVQTITDNDATILVTLNSLATAALSYGTNGSLFTTISDDTLSTTHTFTLSNLAEHTLYNFSVRAQGATGTQLTSDIFSLTTALPSTPTTIDLGSLVISSEKNILLAGNQSSSPTDKKTGQVKNNTIVLPENTGYEFRFSLKESNNIKNITVFLRNRSVLGASTSILGDETQPEANSEQVQVQQVQPGVYVGRLKSKPVAGYYELVARITDRNGNITQVKISDLKIMKPLTIQDSITHEPLEDVRAFFSAYNPQTRQFEAISPALLPIQNPLFSSATGEVSLVLPQGTYKVTLSTLGYSEKTITFIIGDKPSESFPLVFLTKAPFSLFTTSSYLLRSLVDTVITPIATQISIWANSSRFFNLTATLSLLGLIILTFFSFTAKTNTPLQAVWHSIAYHFLPHMTSTRAMGAVIDMATQKGVSKATINIIDVQNSLVISSTTTNAQGVFYYIKDHNRPYAFMIVKQGYAPHTFPSQKEFHITRQKVTTISPLLFFQNVLGFGFELLLFSCFIFEFLFIDKFGFFKTLPFLLLSTFNVTLWIAYLRSK